jgi:predicted alpha-1,2-mannosidase
MNSNILKILTAFIFVTLIDGCQPEVQNVNNLDFVDPHIGGVEHLLQPTRPTVQLPNQVIRMYPVRNDYLDDQISYFPLTISSHRQPPLFGVLPGTGNPVKKTWSERQTYDHDLETVRPYYYSTFFTNENIKTEFAPCKKSGYFRFSFPENADKRLKFHLVNAGSWKIISEKIFLGTEEFSGMKAYLYGVFNKNGFFKNVPSEINSNSVLWIDFTENDDTLFEFKYAISFISHEQAKINLENEIPGWNFETIKDDGEKIWGQVLNKVQVKGGTDAQKRTFFTALYRTYERMVNINEYGRYYSAYDHTVHESDRDFYVDDWVWDTYLAHHPLRIILDPEKEADMLHSYVKMYEQSGWMPQFPLLYKDNPAMHGFHSTIVFLDAWRKNIRDYEIAKAYEGMKKNAMDATMLPWRNGPKTILDSFYREKGYFPALNTGEKETVEEVHSFEKRQSVAITLAHSYDDWALAQLAKDLGHTADYKYFIEQSKNYRNLYHPEKHLMWPKNSEGQWIDIDPKFDGGPGGRDYYDENNGYTYAWQVQHNIQDLIELMGGRKKFIKNLDQLFKEGLGRTKYHFWAKFPDATGLVGQFSMGNEPSFHIPYLYNYAGAPWKTQKRIRFLLDVWFKDNIFGIPGDEDGGGMSAFVVFSSLGFYPVTPGIPVYTIGSPLFEKMSIKLNNGNTFTMIANNYSPVNKYIHSAKLNGKPLDKTWFTHDDLMKGATIELVMGEYPDKKWGTEAGAAPTAEIE